VKKGEKNKGASPSKNVKKEKESGAKTNLGPLLVVD